MPILKTTILGSQIEINFEESEREKLQYLISNFKQRLNEFHDNNGRISTNTILFLAALKAEDQLVETKNLVDKNKDFQNTAIKQTNIIERLNKEIVFLKDQINELKKFSLLKENNNANAIEEIIKLDKLLQTIQKKILSKNDDRY